MWLRTKPLTSPTVLQSDGRSTRCESPEIVWMKIWNAWNAHAPSTAESVLVPEVLFMVQLVLAVGILEGARKGVCGSSPEAGPLPVNHPRLGIFQS